ncbi:MAG: protein kinase [bacterium]
MIGKTVSHYRIIEKIGSGGMGTVYKAKDTKLDRFVALKFLPPHLSQAEAEKKRFIHEAKAASALDHPNICSIYEINETEDGQMFIVMACYEGESLKEKIKNKRLKIKQIIDIAIQIAQGLKKAHEKSIVHRDIKPANILITEDGVVKIVDFGLAKLAGRTMLTQDGTTLGTVAYMSPEQTQGTDIDQQSDIWALGVVLYEMLTGERPFKGNYEQAVIYSIMNEDPVPLRKINSALPEELETIVNHCLKKKPDSRYPFAKAVVKDLQAYQDSLKAEELGVFNIKTLFHRISRPKTAIPLAAGLLVIILIFIWFFNRQAKIRWVREEALPQIEEMVNTNDVWRNLVEPYRLAEQAEEILGDDPKLTEFFSKCALNINIKTTPSGADVYMKEYEHPEHDWAYLGTTPLKKIRMPVGVFRWKFEKRGYRTVMAAASTWNADLTRPDIVIPNEIVRILDKKDSIPSGMVRVPKTATAIGEVEHFFIDRYEVTNKQYKEFVDKGGYRNKKYWKHPFMKSGRKLTWEEAMEEFVDQSGQPGPSTWQAGDYPEGQENYPVSGISWYEAAAYAEFAGKSLPTGYHWGVARGEFTPMVQLPQLGGFALLAPFSNFLGSGPMAVGSLPGVTAYGAYDMAGNVREWCFNETPDGRVIRGGAWRDNTYMYANWSRGPAMDRSAQNGFRCADYPEPEEISESVFQATQILGSPIFDEGEKIADQEPVNNSIFQIYKNQFSYDRIDLGVQTEYKKKSPDWTLEKVSFDAAYGEERGSGYLFLPRNAKPPYQTAVYFGGDAPVFQHSCEDIENYYEFPMFLSFLVKNGRAVFYPVYKGFFERGSDALIYVIEGDFSTHKWAEVCIQQVKDLRRSIDYLETRPDIDTDKLAYYSMSYGSMQASVILAVEKRFRASVLLAGGFGHQGGGAAA